MATLSEFEIHLIEQNAELTKEIKLLGELIPEKLKAVLPHFNVNQFGKDYIAMLNAFRSKIVEDRELNQNK